MRQSRQGVRSTKVINEDATFEFLPTPGVKHKDVYLRALHMTRKTMYSDKTGHFPITSSKGNKYVMVARVSDGIQDHFCTMSKQERLALTGTFLIMRHQRTSRQPYEKLDADRVNADPHA